MWCVIYFRETSIECWVEHIYFCVSVKYYVDIYYVHMMSLNSGISCLSFCLYGLSIGGHLNLNFLLLLGCVNLCHEAQYYDFFLWNWVYKSLVHIYLGLWHVSVIFPLVRMNCASLPLLTKFHLKAIFPDIGIVISAYFQVILSICSFTLMRYLSLK